VTGNENHSPHNWQEFPEELWWIKDYQCEPKSE